VITCKPANDNQFKTGQRTNRPATIIRYALVRIAAAMTVRVSANGPEHPTHLQYTSLDTILSRVQSAMWKPPPLQKINPAGRLYQVAALRSLFPCVVTADGLITRRRQSLSPIDYA